jgi:hypothetical protein
MVAVHPQHGGRHDFLEPNGDTYTAWGPWWANVSRWKCGMGRLYGFKLWRFACHVRWNARQGQRPCYCNLEKT